MKKSFKYSLLLTLGLLIATSLVNAQPVPIGQTEQVRPYESNPTVATLTNITTTFGAERDGNLSTSVSFQGIPASKLGVLYISGFTVPAPAQQFTIGWVDIKIKYRHPGVGDDGYLMGYKTKGTYYAWLQTVVSGADAKFDMNGNPAVRPWVNIPPADGTVSPPDTTQPWTWTDIQNLMIRLLIIRGANAVWDSFFDLYEVWVTVYEHAPPASSTAMSVMPGASNISIVGLESGKYFFVDVYVNGLSGSPGLFGYQATIKYDESVVTALEYFSYWPFITAAPSTINPGVVTVSYYTFIPDSVGFTGVATPLCRIYFQVDADGETPLDLIDQRPTYVTELADVLGGYFVPPLYDGWFGNIPAYYLTIIIVGSGYVIKNPDQATYASGTSVELTANPAAGWTFSNWTGDLTGSTNPDTITMDGDKTVTATFTELPPTTYDLTIAVVGSGSTVPAVGVHTYDEGTEVSVTATAAVGWTFDHWELDGYNLGAINPIIVFMSTDRTLHAVFVYNGPSVPEYPGADISIVAATFGFLATFYLILKRKQQHPTAAATNRNLKKTR